MRHIVDRLLQALPAAAFGPLLLLVQAAQAQAPADPGLLERGRYLMQSIVACGNCHTPQGPQGPQLDKELAGGPMGGENGAVFVAANITPDLETGVGRWTDAQLVSAIREGRRPDGSLIGPPMPVGLYRGLSDRDVAAIVAYLRSVKPVRNVVGRSSYPFPLPPSYGPPVGSVPEVPRTDPVRYGAYLAGPLGHCVECHSKPDARGVPDIAGQLGAGGLRFTGPWGVSIAGNITPRGIGHYTDAQLKTVITTGVRPDGTRLLPPMGVGYYARISGPDLDALVAYLRSLPTK